MGQRERDRNTDNSMPVNQYLYGCVFMLCWLDWKAEQMGL